MRTRLPVLLVAVLALAVDACSSGQSADRSSPAASSPTGSNPEPGGTAKGPGPLTPATPRPDGPAADVSQEVTGGNGIFLADTGAKPAGFEEKEYFAAGTASTYRPKGALPTDGRFQLETGSSAPYRTRIAVRRPPADKFNGTVVVEWLNVSGGVDANPDYRFMADEIVRGGYAWVGVSAQAIGVEGGPVAVKVELGGDLGDLPGKGLKKLDPARYGSLQHPGDAYSYDLYTQIARAVRSGGGLGGLKPERVVAVGESQSAFILTTYVNGVQPLTRAFDGFIVHSRGGAAAPLGEGGGAIDIASAITGPPTIIRTDTEYPVLIIETENDVTSIIGYYPARQDDNDRIRLWEMAGTAHADRTLLGETAGSIDCGVPINDGPQRFIVAAGLRAMNTWIRTGQAPPKAPRLDAELKDGKPTVVRDADGNAKGGIRTPPVDVPVAAVTGEPGPSTTVICLLLGSTKPFDAARVAALYPSRQAYLEAYAKAADKAISSGFVLPEDRAALLETAKADAVGSS